MNVSPRTLAKGTWEPESGRVTMKAAYEWKVGQLVDVEKRTWAGINKPGGHGKITNVYVAADGIVTLDIKYIIGIGSDCKLDASYVRPYQEPTSRGVRSRRPVSLQENNNNNNNNNNNKENKKKQPTKKIVEKQMNKTKKEPPQKEQPKRALSLPQILRPKKKTSKEGRKKRHSVDATEAMSEEDDPQTTLPCGVPRVIACEKVTFLSPLNDYSRMTCRPRQEDVWEKDDDSVSSFGDDDDKEDFVPQTENGVTTTVASTKSPISRTKPLIRGDLPQVESTTRVQQTTQLERIQQAQVHVAQTFVKEVVQHTRSDEPSPKAPEESNEREDHFCSALYYVLDLNDGLVPEDELLRLVNERWRMEQPSDGGPPFDETEIGVYMESLLSKNRIMQADGMVVLI